MVCTLWLKLFKVDQIYLENDTMLSIFNEPLNAHPDWPILQYEIKSKLHILTTVSQLLSKAVFQLFN